MPGFAPIHPVLGITPPTDIFTPSTTQIWPLGMVVDAYDDYWGFGRFVYGKSAAAQVLGNLVTFDEAYTATALASTANTGWPIAVLRQAMESGAYGWYQIEGMAPVKTANSIATGAAVGIGTAGIAGTNSAGKQILGMHVLQASTFTVTKTVRTLNGSKKLVLENGDARGLFIGGALSGTGIASNVLASIDTNFRDIYNTAVSTATAGGITLTMTYTGFILCRFHCPHVQGAIT